MPPTNFNFNNLPVEIQSKIWQMAAESLPPIQYYDFSLSLRIGLVKEGGTETILYPILRPTDELTTALLPHIALMATCHLSRRMYNETMKMKTGIKFSFLELYQEAPMGKNVPTATARIPFNEWAFIGIRDLYNAHEAIWENDRHITFKEAMQRLNVDHIVSRFKRVSLVAGPGDWAQITQWHDSMSATFVTKFTELEFLSVVPHGCLEGPYRLFDEHHPVPMFVMGGQRIVMNEFMVIRQVNLAMEANFNHTLWL